MCWNGWSMYQEYTNVVGFGGRLAIWGWVWEDGYLDAPLCPAGFLWSL